MLEAASSLDCLLLPPFQRDAYPDREFYSPMPRALQRRLLTSSGLVGQDMRHLDKIWFFCGLTGGASPGPAKELIRFRSSISYSDKPLETPHSASNHEISYRFDNSRMSLLE